MINKTYPPGNWPARKTGQTPIACTMSAGEYRRLVGGYGNGAEYGHTADPRARQRGARNRANGQRFEDMLSAACEHYAGTHTAAVEKTPEPMKPIEKITAKVFKAVFTQKAQADYKGVLAGGREIAFEAKHTDDERIYQKAVTRKQREWLALHHNLGALCFVLVSMRAELFARVPLAVWLDMKARYGRLYMTRRELAPYAVPLSACRTETGGLEPGVLFLDGLEGAP